MGALLMTQAAQFRVYRGGVLSNTFADYGAACRFARMKAAHDNAVDFTVKEQTEGGEITRYRADMLRPVACWVAGWEEK